MLVRCFLIALTLYFPAAAQQTSITYQSSNSDINNPERGFYYTTLTNAQKYTSLTLEDMRRIKGEYVPFNNAPFKISSTLVLRIFELKGYHNKATLPQDLLNKISNDFSIARKAGVKLIIRFVYNFTSTPDNAPPYDDAPLALTRKHISQLMPILKANGDIIAAAQLGFIGLWGEGYYSDHYGRPGSTTSKNLRDRADLLDAFLNALPNAVTVQVRYPTMKQDYALFKKKNSNLPRIGFHNDAFLGSSDDLGTYRSYDITAKAKARNTSKVLMDYVTKESVNTAMGGETAVPNPPYDKCLAQGGQAEKQLEQFHFTYLNASYNPKVLSGWAPCIEEIKRRLGYRFVLKHAQLPTSRMKGDTFSIRIEFTNEGYASPINSKKVYLILSNQATGKLYHLPIKANVRSWEPGLHTLKRSFDLPDNIPEGKYRMWLKVCDNNKRLEERPDYSIQFANKDVWIAELGANDLKAELQIKARK